MRFLLAAGFIIQTAAFGQSVAVSIGSASGMPGSTVTVPISLTSSGGAQSVDVEWKFAYSSDITAVTVTAGTSSTNAQKTVACNNATCLIYGLNTNLISDGTVAMATFQIAPSPSANPIPIQVTGVFVSTADGSGITASGGSGAISLSSQVVSLAGLNCTTANLNTPASTPCTATLTGPAPAGGFTVPLSVNNTNVTIPASLQIPPGQASATFTATAAQVTTNQTAVITAANRFTFTLNLASAPAAQLTSLTCSPTSIANGGSGTCTVSLNSSASAAAAVSLSAQSPLTVPQSVTIAAGQTSATFPFTSGATQAGLNASITASLNNQTQTSTISIAGPVQVQVTGLTCTPSSINSSATANCIVTLAAPTSASVTVATSASTSAVTVPATVQIPAGQSSAAFTATAAAVSSDASAILTASAGGSSQTFTLNVIAAAQLNQVVCTPTALSTNSSSQCTVSLTKTTTSPVTISLSSSNVAISVPATATVAAGQSSATFTAAAGIVSLAQTVNITAAYNGQTQHASILLTLPSQPILVTCSPMTVNAPGSSNCTITLSQPAGNSGVIVNLNSGNANVAVPTTVTVVAGSLSGSFVATVGPITQDQTALLAAITNGGSASVTLGAIVPTALSSVSCAPSSLASNGTSTCTVSLNKPAANAAQIFISSNNTALTVPASIAISPGQASATFVATTGTLQSSASASVTATWNGATVSTSVSLVQASQVTSLTCSPSTVNAPGTSTCTVTVPAWPGAGASVLLSSNNANVTVPGLVSFATGLNTATFTATVAAVTANGSATIVAALNGGSQSATLNFTAPAQLTSLVCTPSTLSSNSSSNCVVALNRSAASAMTIGLSSNRVSLTVPASVTIAAGATTTSFSATATTITVNDQATVTATLGSQSQTLSPTFAASSQTTTVVSLVAGVQISGITCTLASLTSNQGTTCLATLTATSSTPVTVALASNTALLSVPANVVVAAGQTHNSFTVTAGVISAATNAMITASVNSTSASTQVALIAGSGSSTLTCAPAVVMAPGSTKCTLVVPAVPTLNGPTNFQSGVVTVSSDNPAVTVPSSVTIPSGASSVTFTANVAMVSAGSTANLTAMVGGSPVKAALTINVGDSLTKLACTSSRLSAGATTACSVSLASPAQGAFGISLTSSNPSGVTLPASISAGLGQSSVSFQLIGGIVSQTQNITITAAAGGSTVQTIVTLSAGNPPSLSLPAELDIKTLTLAQFTVTAQDAYKLPVTLSASGLPTGARFSAASGVFQWTPSSTQTGRYTMTITGADSAGLSSSYLVIIKVSAAKSATTGIFNIASLGLDNTCSPGSLATLMASNITVTNPSPTSRPAAGATSMGGVEVKVNGTAVPLLAVTGQQINFQCPVLPPGTPINITVEMKSGSTLDPIQATMAESTPGIFMVNAASQGAVLIAGTNDLAMPVTDAIPSRPAKIGEYLTIFASGLGPVAENIPAGVAAPLDHTVAAVDQVTVVIGGAEFTPSFAGLAPGQTGLYQVNVGLAENTAIGDSIPLYVRVTHPDGTTSTSNTVTVAIQRAGQ
jgi:uncharacterized protein (TIGR03437 family)